MTKQVIMPSVACIVARTRCDSPDRKHQDKVIGCDNKLPWRLKSDLRRFREITTGHTVIMGRKTFESIGRALPNRTNIVLSKEIRPQADNNTPSDEETQLAWASTPEEALYIADIFTILRAKKELFVIGGDGLFKYFSCHDLISKTYLTEVFADLPGDAFFEKDFPLKEWKISRELDFNATDDDQYGSRFSVYERRERRYRCRPLQEFLTDQATKNAWVIERIASQQSKIKKYAAAHQTELDVGSADKPENG